MLRSASTRPRLSLTLRVPCLGARAMLNPSSTPRKIAMRLQMVTPHRPLGCCSTVREFPIVNLDSKGGSMWCFS